jgi:hypothetical protein
MYPDGIPDHFCTLAEMLQEVAKKRDGHIYLGEVPEDIGCHYDGLHVERVDENLLISLPWMQEF